MQRYKRPFYIIAHNPNNIDEAKEYLELGANALEPDIVHADGKFYVCHLPQISYAGVPTVQEYLEQLKNLLQEKQYNLAMIVWDIKDTDFDLNDFVAIVKENFSGKDLDDITMLLTHSDNHQFLNQYHGQYETIGVGLDESNVPPEELEKIFTGGGQKNFTYADGIVTFLNKPGVFANITAALECRDRNHPPSFKFIYTWVLSLEGALRKYLDTYIDGIMVDAGTVKRLLELIATPPYNDCYELATKEHNPFTAAALPVYILEIKTADTAMAGTDAHLRFTLTGSDGRSLTRLPFHSRSEGSLERGSTTLVSMEGMDLGEIKSLTVEMLTDGIVAGWQPEYITVQSKLMPENIQFNFNTDGEEWITKRRGPVTKERDMRAGP